jgi:hypothetical protein
MNERPIYLPVNWVDGMKINKDHFIAQQHATQYAIQTALATELSAVKYGVTTSAAYNVTIAADNQNAITVKVMACKAVTSGGVIISIPTLHNQANGGIVQATLPVAATAGKTILYVVLVVHPFSRNPVGDPDVNEAPPRYPNTEPDYSIECVDENSYRQYATHPYALTIGRVMVDAGVVQVDEEYIPPCLSTAAHPDLLQLHAELEQFLATLESRCSVIVQKIFKKSQQNDLSELALFLCDRIIIFLSQSLTQMRRTVAYEPPVALFIQISSLARLMKNTIDLRIGSGKDELMNYLSEWCELNQGELESLLSNIANLPYHHNNINEGIGPVIRFAKVISRLFETLSGLEFIGKRKESGIFVKEEFTPTQQESQQAKTKRRFFG